MDGRDALSDLHRLEEQGLIRSFWRESESGRKRKYYQLVEEGRAALATHREQWKAVHEALQAAWGKGVGHV